MTIKEIRLMRNIVLSSCCLFAIAMLVGCGGGSSDAVQMPKNPVPMPDNLQEVSHGSRPSGGRSTGGGTSRSGSTGGTPAPVENRSTAEKKIEF